MSYCMYLIMGATCPNSFLFGPANLPYAYIYVIINHCIIII
jgi:hypothetical protein